ncbi:MAG: phosphate/phosphite/phosphonate ABC transporter substrate-binding protein [Deltaproteobacteria bacterium]|nr:phosphate/phosphite/phosphonate ABC transporter substrate-binding protein [Deltaproteobacteria bacterium]
MRAMLLIVFASLLLASCSNEGRPVAEEPSTQEALNIGLIPEQNIFAQLQRYQPLAAVLSEAVGRKVELKVLRRYGNIIENFNAEHLDGAFFGSFTYVLAHERLGVEVLARPVNANGASTYYGLLLVRKDSGIRRAEDMKGKVFAFVDRATTAGYLFPLAYFSQHRITDYRTYLKETYFTGTHQDVILDVLGRKADIGALKNTVYEEFVRANPKSAAELLVLARSAEVPENGLAVRKDLVPKISAALKSTLLEMHTTSTGRSALNAIGAVRFIETTSKDYQPVVELARAAGVDVAHYTYVNH